MKRLPPFRSLLPLLALALAGALAGYLYYRLVGCVTGTCPIASRPLSSTLYGAAVGALLGFAFTPKGPAKKDGPPETP